MQGSPQREKRRRSRNVPPPEAVGASPRKRGSRAPPAAAGTTPVATKPAHGKLQQRASPSSSAEPGAGGMSPCGSAPDGGIADATAAATQFPLSSEVHAEAAVDVTPGERQERDEAGAATATVRPGCQEDGAHLRSAAGSHADLAGLLEAAHAQEQQLLHDLADVWELSCGEAPPSAPQQMLVDEAAHAQLEPWPTRDGGVLDGPAAPPAESQQGADSRGNGAAQSKTDAPPASKERRQAQLRINLPAFQAHDATAHTGAAAGSAVDAADLVDTVDTAAALAAESRPPTGTPRSGLRDADGTVAASSHDGADAVDGDDGDDSAGGMATSVESDAGDSDNFDDGDTDDDDDDSNDDSTIGSAELAAFRRRQMRSRMRRRAARAEHAMEVDDGGSDDGALEHCLWAHKSEQPSQKWLSPGPDCVVQVFHGMHKC